MGEHLSKPTASTRSLKRLVMQRVCDHTCHCGTSTKKVGAHGTGEFGCGRVMCAAPRKKSCTDDMWVVDGHTITGYTLRFQRHYHQHPCGCWSKWGGDAKLHNDESSVTPGERAPIQNQNTKEL